MHNDFRFETVEGIETKIRPGDHVQYVPVVALQRGYFGDGKIHSPMFLNGIARMDGIMTLNGVALPYEEALVYHEDMDITYPFSEDMTFMCAIQTPKRNDETYTIESPVQNYNEVYRAD